MVDRANVALKTLADYEGIYGGYAFFNGMTLVIVESRTDYVQMMATLRKAGTFYLTLTFDTVMAIALDNLIAAGDIEGAKRVAVTVSQDTVDHMILKREPRLPAVLAQAACWLRYREELLEICGTGHYTYSFEYRDARTINLFAVPKSN
jgi:hypothetical protein